MKSHHPKIKHAVVIVNYGTSTDTIAAVDSIKQTKDTPHIIVVDNGSSPTVVAELKSLGDKIELIISDVNLGFSAANNLGIKRALRLGSQVVYLLNNDTLVDPNLFFRAYRSVAGKNRLAGGKIYYAKGYEFDPAQKNKGNVLWYAGGYYDPSMALSRHTGVDELDVAQYDKTRIVNFVTGCFMAISRGVIKKIGYLDESFFLYLEDTEYCLRAQKAGVEVIYNPSLVLYHKNSSSSGVGSPVVDYYMTRNRFAIAARFGTARLRFALFREALRNLSNPVRRRAFLDYLRGKMGMKT